MVGAQQRHALHRACHRQQGTQSTESSRLGTGRQTVPRADLAFGFGDGAGGGADGHKGVHPAGVRPVYNHRLEAQPQGCGADVLRLLVGPKHGDTPPVLPVPSLSFLKQPQRVRVELIYVCGGQLRLIPDLAATITSATSHDDALRVLVPHVEHREAIAPRPQVAHGVPVAPKATGVDHAALELCWAPVDELNHPVPYPEQRAGLV
mmetsp:Transcript_29043/g.72914  ORF Transcript_29043/g.72914 Transcript_29043/m.72914 type:complete len:206 (+) Transcript_29043:170-787(+)